MTDYSELVKKLRDLHRDPRPASAVWLFENQLALYDAADAIDALQAEIRQSMQRCAECGDKLAAYEDMMERWAFREIEEIDRLCRRVNALGGTDRMAKYYKAEEQGLLIVLPDVPEKDRQPGAYKES